MKRAADSAGRSWAGREFSHHSSEYAGDDGSAPATWVEAVQALHAGSGSIAACVDALRDIRLLVPLLAAGESGVDEHGRAVEKTQELSIVTVSAPDGGEILPMFASVAAMREWNSSARPVPVSAQRAAAAALDGPARIVVDPGSARAFVVGRSALEALLTGSDWRSPLTDTEVRNAVLSALFAEPAVRGVVIASGDPLSTLAGSELEAHALVRDDPSAPEQVRAAAARLGESELLRARVASVAVRLHRAPGTLATLPLTSPAVAAVTRAEWSERCRSR